MSVAVAGSVAVAVSGCKPKGSSNAAPSPGAQRMSDTTVVRLPSLGTRKLEGNASELRPSPDGRVVTVLLDGEKPRLEGVPPLMRVGALWVVPTGEGAAVKIANGASNAPGGWLFTSDGRWLLALASYDPTQQAGELLVQDLTQLSVEPSRLGGHVSYFKPSADGKRVAFVEAGVLSEGPLPSGPFRQVAGEVGTAQYSPDGKQLYFRRRSAAGGGVYQVELSAEKATPRRFVDAVGEYVVSEDSKWVVAMARTNPRQVGFELFVADAAKLKAVKIGDDVMRFAISRDGQSLARLELPSAVNAAAAAPSDLQVGELWLSKVNEPGSRKVADKVHEFEFTRDSSKLYFRDHYQELGLMGGALVEKVGDLTEVTLPDGAPKLLQRRSPNYELSPDGVTIAYTARIERPEYSRYLYLLKEGGEPVKLKDWLYDYTFSPGGERLLFRGNCTREGRSCDLLVQDVAKAGTALPRREAEATFNFKLSEDGNRVLTTFAHTHDESFDVSVSNLSTGQRKTLDQFVVQPVHFVAKDGSKVAWIVSERKRAGVYVGTDVP